MQGGRENKQCTERDNKDSGVENLVLLGKNKHIYLKIWTTPFSGLLLALTEGSLRWVFGDHMGC